MVLNFHDLNCFFFSFLSELTVSTLLNILQSLLAPYQLLRYKMSTFTIIVLLWLASNLEQIHTHIPYFYFSFSVLWSSPVQQLIKSEVLMTTTYLLLQWLSQYTLRVYGKFPSVSLPNQKILQ